MGRTVQAEGGLARALRDVRLRVRRRGQRWERRSEVTRSQGPEPPGPPTIGKGDLHPECKGHHCLIESRAGTGAGGVPGVFSDARKASGGSWTQPFREAVELGVVQSILRYDKSQMPPSFRGSRSLRQRSGQERPADGADTGRPKTPREQNHAFPCSLVDCLGLCQDPGGWAAASGTFPSGSSSSTCTDPSFTPILH